MFKLWSEWDIGENNLIFANKDAGMRWLQNNPAVAEIAELNKDSTIDACIAACFDDGYFSWETLEIIE